MTTLIHVIDSFTDEPFAGNPAGVTILESFPDDEWMQKVAREMSLPEISFLVHRPDGDYDLRWFSPTLEIDLCGHATLAAAHVLGGDVKFHTRSGVLSASPGAGSVIEMDFPSDPLEAVEVPAALAGTGVRYCGRGRFDLLAELTDAATVRAYIPDLPAIAGLGTRGLIVTAAGDRPGVDCVSRFFAPNAGIAEDPVTGSAHCTLAGFWGDRLGTETLVGEQASPRGGTVFMRREGDRVILGGHAVAVSEVRLLV